MYFHIITSNKCNLNCFYCSEKAFSEPDTFPEDIVFTPLKPHYNLKTLKSFIESFKRPTITFYGGEPLINVEFIREVINEINARFMIQTNGTLLNTLNKEDLSKFNTILVSIDGNENTTDKYRGRGTYKKIIENISYIKNNGFKGELIARMTIEEQNIFKAVKHLIEDEKFNSIHFQLDANFWFNDWKTRDYKNWVYDNYIPNLKKLIDYWISLLREGKIIKIYPFIAIVNSYLNNEKNVPLRCGSGHSNYTVQTDGKITPCPIMIGMSKYYAGDINKKELKTIKVLPKRCKKCTHLSMCGGRCLYSNILSPWPQSEVDGLCDATKFLIDYIKEQIPTIINLIDTNIIHREDLEYEKYNGTEIIP